MAVSGSKAYDGKKGGMRTCLRVFLGVGIILIAAVGLVMGFFETSWAQSVTEVTLVNIEFEGTKIWVPGAVVVHKGDRVKLHAINNVKSDPPVHGLAIEGYDLQVVVEVGKPVSMEFKADKAGVFPIICHLHPPHVGTQLVVLDN
jgi:nitrosocyanin